MASGSGPTLGGNRRHAGPIAVVLSWPGGELALPNGEYLIGRSSACDVVIDDSRVSRRHARLEVDGTDVHVVDLESRNGVFVNDRQVRRMQALADGDVILIGGLDLTVTVGAEARRPKEAPVAVSSLLDADTDDDDTSERDPVTRTFDNLELISRIVERAIQAGHMREAEAIAEGHLRRVLDDLLQRRPVSPNAIGRVVEIAFRLAGVTRRGQWFDYIIDVRRASLIAPPPAELEYLARLRGEVDRIDITKIRRLIDALRSGGASMDRLRAAQRLQELLDRR